MEDTRQWEAEEAEARDPATSPSRLADLMETQLDAVVENPALALITFEYPDFWRELTETTRRVVAQSPKCPAGFVG